MPVKYCLMMLALIPTPLLAQSFNLQCVGKMHVGTAIDMLKKENQMPSDVTYRIDFNKGRWCSVTCRETFPIVDVNEKYIVLEADKGDDDDHFAWDVFINRESGKLTDRMTSPEGYMVLTTGDCTKQPFTGFPSTKF